MPAGPSSASFNVRIDQSLLVLYASVSESVGWATAALLEEDTELAERVVADDRDMDEQCRQLTGLVKEHLGESARDPEELEYMVGVLQMIPELERSADLAEHVAQRARNGLGGQISARSRGLVQSMCDSGLRMWQLAAQAFAERSRDLLFELAELDDEMDNLSARLVREGATAGVEPTVAAELALIARFYERIGDHAVNLARRSAEMGAPRRLAPVRAMRRKRTPAGPPGATAAPKEKESMLGRIRRLRVLPPDTSFHDLFAEAAHLAKACGDEIVLAVDDLNEIETHYGNVRASERRSDEVTVEVLRLLDATFVTPYDREDIHALAEALDDVVDDMYAAVATIYQTRVDTPMPELAQQAKILASMGQELDGLVSCMKVREGARPRLERIESLEREGDALLRRTMGKLFSGEFEALEVLRWKDVLQAMEDAMNKIESAADVVEAILVKTS
jgi:uncharacterized protein Yka (UPF0111/DUF47 family)